MPLWCDGLDCLPRLVIKLNALAGLGLAWQQHRQKRERRGARWAASLVLVHGVVKFALQI
jgi:hypothetical protein